ncbi:hypothetical protein G6549_09150 [Bacillus sp. MM2020_1]|nr:hypothetical protein [Bacillus sp. MM2020_1]
MKKLFLFIFAIAFIFSFDVRALADEGHSHTKNLKQATENLKKDHDESGGEDATTMDHDSGTDMEGMNHDSGSDMEGMNMEGGSSGEVHDHHAAVVETPPNYKVLGTYGAVNLLFILIGVWNKWFRRKGDVINGHA